MDAEALQSDRPIYQDMTQISIIDIHLTDENLRHFQMSDELPADTRYRQFLVQEHMNVRYPTRPRKNKPSAQEVYNNKKPILQKLQQMGVVLGLECPFENHC